MSTVPGMNVKLTLTEGHAVGAHRRCDSSRAEVGTKPAAPCAAQRQAEDGVEHAQRTPVILLPGPVFVRDRRARRGRGECCEADRGHDDAPDRDCSGGVHPHARWRRDGGAVGGRGRRARAGCGGGRAGDVVHGPPVRWEGLPVPRVRGWQGQPNGMRCRACAGLAASGRWTGL